jgi:sterol desaturase/sphingolipid hydroxylase (fatty acid hydroxylase superfamily)
MNAIITFAVAVGGMCALLFIAVAAESRTAANRKSLWQAATFNLSYFVATSAVVVPLSAISAPVVVMLVNSAGGGFIRVPGSGWLVGPGVIAVLLLTDLLEYWYHRAQHRLPLLWRLHSLHHSEEHFNSTTAARQCWLDGVVRVLVIFPAVGIVFRADPVVILIARLLIITNNVHAHMSMHRSWGRLWWLLNSPQYHRCHHSLAADCIDRNLAPMFPFWDVLFGTCHRPRPEEYGATGLNPALRPTLLGAILWPLPTFGRKQAT